MVILRWPAYCQSAISCVSPLEVWAEKLEDEFAVFVWEHWYQINFEVAAESASDKNGRERHNRHTSEAWSGKASVLETSSLAE